MRQHRMSKDRLLHTTFECFLILLLLLFSVSCTTPTSTPEPTPITASLEETPSALPTVRYLQFKVFDPVYIALYNGYFEDHGIHVVLAGDTIAGPNAIQAVASGSAEAGLSSVPALITANAAGLPVQGVVDIQTTLESQALQKWFVPEDSPYYAISDLADSGARYGINIQYSSFHFTSLMALDSVGLDETDVSFQLLSFPDQITALLNGELDVIGLIPPYHGYLRQQAEDADFAYRELWNDYDLYGSKHVSLIFVNRIWAENNPEQAEAFVSGVVEAIAWIEENPAEAKAIIEEYTEVPASVIEDYHFTDDGQVVPEDISFWYDFLFSKEYVTADWLEIEDIASNKYNLLVGGDDE